MRWWGRPKLAGNLRRTADWGPHVDTGRVADISPGLMEALGIETDDEVEVKFPGRLTKPPEKQPKRRRQSKRRRQPKRRRQLKK